MDFKDFSLRYDILEDFDKVIKSINLIPLSENVLDADEAKILEKILNRQNTPTSFKSIMGAIAKVAETGGAKAVQLATLFTPEGIEKVKTLIKK